MPMCACALCARAHTQLIYLRIIEEKIVIYTNSDGPAGTTTTTTTEMKNPRKYEKFFHTDNDALRRESTALLSHVL